MNKLSLTNTGGLCFCLASCLTAAAVSFPAVADTVVHTVSHTFSINDVQGGFDGTTYGGVAGSVHDPSIICGLEGGTPCPADARQPLLDKTGVWIYPVDSEFGFYVTDFVGAAPKKRDFDYAEGWVGNIEYGGEVIGLAVSNAATDTFKVKPPMGTWCAGLGANTVKCSTEHYTVLEHIKTCYETIPYSFADPFTGVQGDLLDPATLLDPLPLVIGTCEEGRLDNVLRMVSGGALTDNLLVPDADGFPAMPANESTVRDDIAVNTDYAVTRKDDGKALYRFGSLIKRPNDVRMYVRMALPQEWKDNPETSFAVSRAELRVEHLITNNPNDQLRPEDMENEAATGRLPGYTVVGDVWVSNRDCYEGDGDFIPEGTVLRNIPFAEMLGDEAQDPLAYSTDLLDGFTNAWYTTTDRDPFETDPVSGVGPRWRLKSNKFGQDIPGLEIPYRECSAVPFTSDNIKYPVREPTVTTINLLDFKGGPMNSPLRTSEGWMRPNGVNIPSEAFPGVSINGLPLTEDFDLAVYIKGDRKTTELYNATLVIEYEGEGGGTIPAPTVAYDLSLDAFKVPKKIKDGDTRKLSAYVSNAGPDIANGMLVIEGQINGIPVVSFSNNVGPLAPNSSVKLVSLWTAPVSSVPEMVVWTATLVSDADTRADNNTLAAQTLVR